MIFVSVSGRFAIVGVAVALAVSACNGPGTGGSGSLSTTACRSWSRPFYGTQTQTVLATAALGPCDMVVAGELGGESTLSSDIVAPNVQSSTAPYRVFLARLAGDGSVLWKKILGPGGQTYPMTLLLARDLSGGFVLAGTLNATLDLDGHSLTPAGNSAWFVAGMGADGATRFARIIGSGGGDVLEGLALAPDGSILVAGTVAAPATVDGQTLAQGGTLVRLDGATGAGLRAVGFGAQRARAVDVNDAGDVAVLLEETGPCPPCDIALACGHQCPPAIATTTVKRVTPALAVSSEIAAVATRPVGLDPGPRTVGMRLRTDGTVVVINTDPLMPVVRQYGPSNDLLKMQTFATGVILVARIEMLTNQHPVLVQRSPFPTVLELDGDLHVARAREITEGGITIEDFALDPEAGVLVGGALFGNVTVAGMTWNSQQSWGSLAARIDPSFESPPVDGGMCGDRGATCVSDRGCCPGLFCTLYTAQTGLVCAPPGG
jgi:hypothetical protein